MELHSCLPLSSRHDGLPDGPLIGPFQQIGEPVKYSDTNGTHDT